MCIASDNPHTLQTIADRHSVRTFTDQEVSEADLRTILEAANQAPSAHNQQSWHFMVLRGEKKQALSKMVSTRAGDFPKASAALLRMAARSINSASAIVAVANTGELIEHGSKLFQIEAERSRNFFRTMEIQSSAAAVENMLLAATSMGLGTVWLGILFLIQEEVLHFLGQPEGEFMAVIPVGYPAKESKGPQKRELDLRVTFFD